MNNLFIVLKVDDDSFCCLFFFQFPCARNGFIYMAGGSVRSWESCTCHLVVGVNPIKVKEMFRVNKDDRSEGR